MSRNTGGGAPAGLGRRAVLVLCLALMGCGEDTPGGGAGGPAGPEERAAGAPGAGKAQDTSVAGCVRAYCAMLDFGRTQAFGRAFRTPDAMRSEAERQLRAALPQLDAGTRSTVLGLPAAWARLRAKWDAAGEAERERQRDAWRSGLLRPNALLPYTGATRHFQTPDGGIALAYPADWTAAQTEVDGAGALFLTAAGPSTTWQQALDPRTAPAGVLFVLAEVDEAMRAVPDLVAGARLVARTYVVAPAPGLREVAAFRVGPGGMIVLAGPLSDRPGRHFCWVGALPYGGGQFLAARFLGPVAELETLLPIFSGILDSLEVRSPSAEGSVAVDLAASTIGNAVVSAGWPD